MTWHAVALSVEALRYRPEDRGSIPNVVISICHGLNSTGRTAGPWNRLIF